MSSQDRPEPGSSPPRSGSSGPVGGTFTITNRSSGRTTEPIPYNATTGEIDMAAKSIGIEHLGLTILTGTIAEVTEPVCSCGGGGWNRPDPNFPGDTG